MLTPYDVGVQDQSDTQRYPGGIVDPETRELEPVLTVADELHFGRSAVRLSIAQPALSKAIRRIETRLGVPLFLRTGRHVELTPAGKALQENGRPALHAIGAAARSARRAGDTEAHPRLVLKPGGDAGLLSPILAGYAHEPDARRVHTLFSGPAPVGGGLIDGLGACRTSAAPGTDGDRWRGAVPGAARGRRPVPPAPFRRLPGPVTGPGGDRPGRSLRAGRRSAARRE